MNCGKRGLLLRTLGHPVLTGPAGEPVAGLRRKDLALLAYLCVEGPRPHSRARLAALLWGESPEVRARHSLTQALGRIGRAAGCGALVVERDAVRSTGAVACDAEWLLAGDERLDALLTPYEGPFLEGFEAGFGSEEFGEWADGRRAELRNAALRWLERTGEAAEGAGDWALALRIGERGTQVDPVHEEAHRRVLRALLETGERNRALRHFQDFARWLADDVGGEPDPETLALAERIRAATAASPPPPPQSPPPPAPAPAPLVPADPAAEDAPIAEDAVEVASCDPPRLPRPAVAAAASPRRRRAMADARRVSLWLLAAAMAMALMRLGVSLLGTPGSPTFEPAGQGDGPAISHTDEETQKRRPPPPCVSAAPGEKVVG
ncbi:DNA-binding transcriptional activator of the SARP family [bacterium JGI 053]|nr:DNA-binding transcriptional activator of the SARP family [bacterium JGI 053]